MIEKKWQFMDGSPCSDIRAEVSSQISQFPGSLVYIGSDSQQFSKFTEYVTVLIVRRPEKGGRVLICREKVPRIGELRQRLANEVWRSTELAMELQVPFEGCEPIEICEIHIDANMDQRHRSSKYVEELVGMAMGQGFTTVVKPHSWAASHAADHAVKHKNERKKPLPQRRNSRQKFTVV